MVVEVVEVLIIRSPRGIVFQPTSSGALATYLHQDDGYKYHIIGDNGTWTAWNSYNWDSNI